MATFNNGESGSSVRTKINNVLQHTDGTASELVINDAGADVDFRVESDTNANMLFVDAGNNRVGIGTSSPAGLLHVAGADTFNIPFRIENTTGSTSFDIKVGLGATSLETNGAQPLTLNTNNTERMRIDSSGNVGIGTSSPTANLQVGGSNGGDRTFQMYSAGATRGVFSTDGVNGVLNVGCTNDSTTGRIAFRTGAALTERMRIDESGNVGIGTTSPTVKVDVSGASNLASRARFTRSDQSKTLQLGGNRDTSNCPYIGSETNHAFVLITNDTERMRIDTSGNVLVGTTNADPAGNNVVGTALLTFGGASLSRLNSSTLDTNRDGSDGTIINLRKAGTTVGSISVTASATAYNTSSDYRLKEDVQPMVGASDRLMALKPVNFAWKADGSRVDGFLAHEAQEVVPEAVTGEKDGEEMQAIDQSKLVPLLTAALQEALTKIEALEARIAALEA